MTRKILFSLAFLLLTAAVTPANVAAATFFEHREQTILPGNIVYELNRQVTSAGLLDVHIITVPLWNPYVTVRPVQSRQELGLRETTLNMLRDSGAVAGINADFFSMAGSHAQPQGPVIIDGSIKSINAVHNQGGNEFATLFVNQNNFPFMSYIRPQVIFMVDGRQPLEIPFINKVHDLENPVIITREGMETTFALNQRHAGLVAVTVRDGVVAGVSAPGQTVAVPENGFLVVMPGHIAAWNHVAQLWLDRPAEFRVISDLEMDLSYIRTAIGGGGLILQNGGTVHDGGTVIGGRHPRSAVGISQDRQHLLLMTVDGRNHSAGATHDELANLLRRYGAWDAMHFDGGGSSTMAVQLPGGPLQMVNTPSDGSPRRVINSFGVFNYSVPGEPVELVITPYARDIPLGGTLALSVYGLDANRHTIPIDQSQVQFRAHIPGEGGLWVEAPANWHESSYLPDRTGALLIEARYGELVAQELFMVQSAMPPGMPFADPLRAAMTELMPGLAHDFSVLFPAQPQYGSFRVFADGSVASVISMTAAGGGFIAADRNQWARFASDTQGADFIIIQLDSTNFTHRQEFELFHDALAAHQEEGRLVFVVTNNAEAPSFNIRDGVRYIDLGQTSAEAASINFRIIDGQIWYDFQ